MIFYIVLTLTSHCHFVLEPGNIERDEAESMVQDIEDVMFKEPNPVCKTLFPSQHLANRVVKLEKGLNYFYHAQGHNPSDDNSALVHYIQVSQLSTK